LVFVNLHACSVLLFVCVVPRVMLAISVLRYSMRACLFMTHIFGHHNLDDSPALGQR